MPAIGGANGHLESALQWFTPTVALDHPDATFDTARTVVPCARTRSR